MNFDLTEDQKRIRDAVESAFDFPLDLNPLGAELGSMTSRRILRCSPLTPAAIPVSLVSDLVPDR